MQADGRVMTKADRQRLIASLVSRKPISTQHELREALEAEGVVVTQATVSRDIRELGLEKAADSLGHSRYVTQARRRRAEPRAALQAVLAEFGRDAVAAQNIVVVRSELGSAPAIARAIDRLEHPQVVGTLAGDDTCLLIAADAGKARALAREIAALIEG